MRRATAVLAALRHFPPSYHPVVLRRHTLKLTPSLPAWYPTQEYLIEDHDGGDDDATAPHDTYSQKTVYEWPGLASGPAVRSRHRRLPPGGRRRGAGPSHGGACHQCYLRESG